MRIENRAFVFMATLNEHCGAIERKVDSSGVINAALARSPRTLGTLNSITCGAFKF